MTNNNDPRPVPQLLIQGNPVDGLRFTGPFADSEDAGAAGERDGGEWWIAGLQQPEADDHQIEVWNGADDLQLGLMDIGDDGEIDGDDHVMDRENAVRRAAWLWRFMSLNATFRVYGYSISARECAEWYA
jgi:hypothetical protein